MSRDEDCDSVSHSTVGGFFLLFLFFSLLPLAQGMLSEKQGSRNASDIIQIDIWIKVIKLRKALFWRGPLVIKLLRYLCANFRVNKHEGYSNNHNLCIQLIAVIQKEMFNSTHKNTYLVCKRKRDHQEYSLHGMKNFKKEGPNQIDQPHIWSLGSSLEKK